MGNAKILLLLHLPFPCFLFLDTATFTKHDKQKQACDTLSISYLQRQAIEYGKRGKFKEAQIYAKKLIEISTISEKGYLLSGELYSYQGNQQSAMDVYGCGIRQLTTAIRANKNCDSQQHNTILSQRTEILRSQYNTAKVAQEKRINFIDDLGCIDVIVLIFEHLLLLLDREGNRGVNGLTDRVIMEITFVSKSWRDFALFQLTMFWRSARCWSPMRRTNSAFRLLLNPSGISHHIYHLSLTDITVGVTQVLIDLAQNQKLNHVKRVEISKLVQAVVYDHLFFSVK